MKPRNKYQRALEVISRVAVNQDPEEEDKAWGDVYKLAHSLSGTCGNPHKDWQTGVLKRLEEELKKV